MKRVKGCLTRPSLVHSQQTNDRKIGLQDQPLFAEGDIPHRGQFVQLEIARPRSLQFLLGPAQLLVLHLQLNLMHPQFMERLPQFLRQQAVKVLG